MVSIAYKKSIFNAFLTNFLKLWLPFFTTTIYCGSTLRWRRILIIFALILPVLLSFRACRGIFSDPSTSLRSAQGDILFVIPTFLSCHSNAFFVILPEGFARSRRIFSDPSTSLRSAQGDILFIITTFFTLLHNPHSSWPSVNPPSPFLRGEGGFFKTAQCAVLPPEVSVAHYSRNRGARKRRWPCAVWERLICVFGLPPLRERGRAGNFRAVKSRPRYSRAAFYI